MSSVGDCEVITDIQERFLTYLLDFFHLSCFPNPVTTLSVILRTNKQTFNTTTLFEVIKAGGQTRDSARFICCVSQAS